MRQANFSVTPKIEEIIIEELGKSDAPKFLEKLQKSFKHLSILYSCRNQDVSFAVLNAQLLDISDAAKSLVEALNESDYSVETLIRQGQVLRGIPPSANNLHTDLVGYLEDIFLGIETISEDLKTPAKRPRAWQEREVIGLIVEYWIELRGSVPGKTRDGRFHRFVNSLLKEIELTPRSADLIWDEISLYLTRVEN